MKCNTIAITAVFMLSGVQIIQTIPRQLHTIAVPPTVSKALVNAIGTCTTFTAYRRAAARSIKNGIWWTGVKSLLQGNFSPGNVMQNGYQAAAFELSKQIIKDVNRRKMQTKDRLARVPQTILKGAALLCAFGNCPLFPVQPPEQIIRQTATNVVISAIITGSGYLARELLFS